MTSTESVKTWLVKHVVSPVDRVSFRVTGGRLRLTAGRPVLLLSTVGRRTSRVRSTPVFYLRDGVDLVVCNVRPPGERANPWPQNLDHQPMAEVTVEERRRLLTGRHRRVRPRKPFSPPAPKYTRVGVLPQGALTC